MVPPSFPDGSAVPSLREVSWGWGAVFHLSGFAGSLHWEGEGELGVGAAQVLSVKGAWGEQRRPAVQSSWVIFCVMSRRGTAG